MFRNIVGYLRNLSASKTILWCYAVWYCAIVSMYFEPSLTMWLTALVVSLVIGIALNLSVSRAQSTRGDPWQTVRLFLMPFCVSSYSSLIRGKGFIVIFPRNAAALEIAAGSCVAFLAVVWALKKTATEVTVGRPPARSDVGR